MVLWANSVGIALTRTTHYRPDEPFIHSGSFTLPTSHPTARPRLQEGLRFDRQPRTTPHPVPPFKKSFRDVLLTPAPSAKPHSRSSLSPTSPSIYNSFSFKGRCFRCLDHAHRAFMCRDHIQCIRCFKTDDKSRSCMNRLTLNVYRAMSARPAYLSAFVPLSDDFFARQNRHLNAILVDVAPLVTLATSPKIPSPTGSQTVSEGTLQTSTLPATANETLSSSCLTGSRANTSSAGNLSVWGSLDYTTSLRTFTTVPAGLLYPTKSGSG